MNYRRLGRTGLQVSVVGFGTCQLRLIPERQAIETLLRGFELGVNLVHTAPDYEGADDLVARAVRQASRPVIVCSQAYGPMTHFERLFESTCEKLGKDRLELFGIACVDDREAQGENVWGAGGMVDFLLRKKQEGRLGGIFCTTHGNPAYIRALIERDVFDALMVAYNALGFHLLSYYPGSSKAVEHLPGTGEEIFPLAHQRDVGLMIMKPLAGGLLCQGKAFPARASLNGETAKMSATRALRHILGRLEVACVVPGTASPEEAEENARAGYGSLLDGDETPQVHASVRELNLALCSRCGGCDTLCSNKLPISWLHRSGYISVYPSETFETPAEYEFFRLHPAAEPACGSCRDVTCSCPQGIDIPGSLTQIHGVMRDLLRRGLVPPPPPEVTERASGFAARVITAEVPATVAPGVMAVIRLYVENNGSETWLAHGAGDRPRAALFVAAAKSQQVVKLRHDVHAGERAHFSFELQSPKRAGLHEIDFSLVVGSPPSACRPAVRLLRRTIAVDSQPQETAVQGYAHVLLRSPWHSLLKRLHRVGGGLRRRGRALLRRAVLGRKVSPVGHTASPELRTAAPESGRYDAAYLEHNCLPALPANTLRVFWLTVENRGTIPWQREPPDGAALDLAVFLDGVCCVSTPLPVPTVAPGERVTFHGTFRTTSDTGAHRLTFQMVRQGVALFEAYGVAPLTVSFEATPEAATASSRLMDEALEINHWFSLPSKGITWSATGRPYPVFARSARGCRITDLEGRSYIDYVMGWGSALLGYANERVQRAVADALGSAGVISLPPVAEMEVTRLLRDDIPCAEMAVFGKNGSDVCTAAVRLARIHTRREMVLVCGYHGWQDWHVEKMGFAATGVLERARTPVHTFRFNDLDDFARVLHAHRGEVAAVMLEPAGPVEGLNGPLQDADPTFLRQVAALTRDAGALLIFDEIITGFRYRQGSVQKATGVVPDLACFGKALSAGMPLSALVGRAAIFRDGMKSIYYGPTFKSEVYSLVAAREALHFYKEHDIPAHIESYARRLRDGVNSLCRSAGVPAEVIGPPFRMVLAFREADTHRVDLMRTLVQQELLQQGVLTYMGFMLPSYAHDEQALTETLRAFDHAMQVLAEALRQNDFIRRLEIPMMRY